MARELGRRAYQPLDRKGTPRAGFRPRQQCRPSPQGAEEEDAARGHFPRDEARGHYEKPSERRAREKAEAIRRARKLARKKLQREGLLPMKPRVVPGTLGRGGPARGRRF